MSKYICVVDGKGCSLAFITKDHCTIRIDKDELVDLVSVGGKQDESFGTGITTVTLLSKGKSFLCFESDFKEYFVSLAEMRNQKIEEILDL